MRDRGEAKHRMPRRKDTADIFFWCIVFKNWVKCGGVSNIKNTDIMSVVIRC